MTTESGKNNQARAKIVCHIIAQLRSRCSGRDRTDAVLDDLRRMSMPDALAEELLADPNRRANLKRVAFPEENADLRAIDAAIAAGNTLVSLDALAGRTFFEFDGRSFETHARKNPDGMYIKAKNGTLKILYSASRLTLDDKKYLRNL